MLPSTILSIKPMKSLRFSFLSILFPLLLGAGIGSAGASPKLSFKVILDQFSGDQTFRMRIYNESRAVDIKSVELSIGNTDRVFDAAYFFTDPAGGGTHTVVTPNENYSDAITDSRLIVDFLSA